MFKKVFWVLLIVLLTVGCSEIKEIIPTPHPTLTGNIVDLIDYGAIKVLPRGSNITQINVTIESLYEGKVEVRIPVGTYLIAQNSNVQNMIVTKSQTVILKSHGSELIALDAACANIHRRIPSGQHTFTLQKSGSEELDLLLSVIGDLDMNYAVRQAAIWIVTDDADYDDLGILVTQSNYSLFGNRVISKDNAAEAMQILDEVGIDVTSKRIWNDREEIAEGALSGFEEWIRERE